MGAEPPPPSIAFLVHSNVRQQEQSTVFWQVILHKVILGIIPTTCTVMKAIAEKQKVEKHLASESQRCTHTCPGAGVRLAAPYITMMKHSDQTTADLSFINVTADAAVEKGLSSPCCQGGERNMSQHSLTCHAGAPSILSELSKPSPSEQTRPHKLTRSSFVA